MRTLARTLSVMALVLVFAAPALRAQQQTGTDWYRWYIGPQAGVMIFETPSQTRGAIITAGGHMFVQSKRVALLLSVEEGVGNKEVTEYTDASAPAGTCAGAVAGRRCTIFNDIRKYSATLIGLPLRKNPQPYLGVGVGIVHVVSPQPQGVFTTPDELANAQLTAQDLGSSGFGSFVGGIQWRSNRLVLFAQYQITTSPQKGKLLEGPTHTFTGGIRLGLGSAREGVSGGGD